MGISKNGFEEYVLEIFSVHNLPGFRYPQCVAATLVSSKDNNGSLGFEW